MRARSKPAFQDLELMGALACQQAAASQQDPAARLRGVSKVASYVDRLVQQGSGAKSRCLQRVLAGMLPFVVDLDPAVRHAAVQKCFVRQGVPLRKNACYLLLCNENRSQPLKLDHGEQHILSFLLRNIEFCRGAGGTVGTALVDALTSSNCNNIHMVVSVIEFMRHAPKVRKSTPRPHCTLLGTHCYNS
jgi:hypothetical protein